MAKKKKSAHKKHSFAPASSKPDSRATAPRANASAPANTAMATVPSPAGVNLMPVHPAIYGDVLRSLVLAGVLALVQAVLWLLFTHSSLGSAVYGLVKL